MHTNFTKGRDKQVQHFIQHHSSMLNEMFDSEQTSSNIIQHNFFLLFSNFQNFEDVQTSPTFHPTSRKFDVG